MSDRWDDPPPSTEGRFARFHDECDKGYAHGYLTVYDRLLEGVDVRAVLEVGVMAGASLDVWAGGCPGAEIVAVEVDEGRAGEVAARWPRVDVVCGDGYAGLTVERIAERHGWRSFDLIVDDGSHELEDQRTFVARYAPLLAPGGVMVVEDILPGYGGDAVDVAGEIVAAVPEELRSFAYIVDLRWSGSRWQDDVLVVVDTRPEPWRGVYR